MPQHDKLRKDHRKPQREDHRRVYVWETVPVDEQDSGANDEGYYYDWCNYCRRRTEQGDGTCFGCNS